jgi:hypothetical protein
MKKLLTIGFILICLVSYSKPIPVYVLRYKGQVLDIKRTERLSGYITFEFNKDEMSQNDLLNFISKGIINLDDDDVTFYYSKSYDDKLPSYLTVTKETFDFK